MRRLSNDKLTWMGNGAHCHRCPSTSPRHLAAKMVENIFSSNGQVPNLEAAFQVKALDVEAVGVGPPDEGVLQIRHDLLPGELSLSGMVFFLKTTHLIVRFMLRCLSRCFTSLSVRVRFRTLRSLWLLRGRLRFLWSSTLVEQIFTRGLYHGSTNVQCGLRDNRHRHRRCHHCHHCHHCQCHH